MSDAETPALSLAGLESAPASTLVVAPPPVPRLDPEALAFTGSYGEYFRIWIVNLGLSVATLGLYSPWAKVRRLEYLWRNTRAYGTSFDYLGSPIGILKGRLIGFGLFMMYSLAGSSGPGFLGLAALVIAGLLPWMLVKTLRFRLHNTSFRGLRFAFTGSTARAYWVFLGLPLLTILTLGTLTPFVHQRIKAYEHQNARYGQTAFGSTFGAGPFYGAYIAGALIAFALMIAAVIFSVVSAFFDASASFARQPGAPPPGPGAVTIGVILVGYVAALIGSQAFLRSRVENAVWNATTLGAHRFTANLEALPLFWIMVTNIVLTVVTLGVFTPFAQIRMARYMTSALWLAPADMLDTVHAGDAVDVGAAGEEAAGFFDFDISF